MGYHVSVSILVSIPISHTGDRGSIHRQKGFLKYNRILFEQFSQLDIPPLQINDLVKKENTLMRKVDGVPCLC